MATTNLPSSPPSRVVSRPFDGFGYPNHPFRPKLELQEDKNEIEDLLKLHALKWNNILTSSLETTTIFSPCMIHMYFSQMKNNHLMGKHRGV
jgi:hypothetical protein